MTKRLRHNSVMRGVLHGLLLASAAIVLTACGDKGFTVTTEFASPKGIEVGEAVMYEGQQVGEVSSIEEGLNSTKVELALIPEQVALFHSKSVVVVNTMEEGTPVEIYNRTTTDPVALQEGQELQGLNSMFELGAWMVGDASQIGSGTLSDLFESFTGYIEGEQFQSDKEQVQQQLSSAALAAKEAVSSVEVDINQALQELKASEGEMAAAISQMGDELSPVVRELTDSGSQLIAQLEQFAQNLETQAQENPDFGKELMQSLVDVFEQLDAEINGQITIDTDEGSKTYDLDSQSTDSVEEVDSVDGSPSAEGSQSAEGSPSAEGSQ